MMFERAGFNVIALPGRDLAFLAEFGPPRAVGLETLVEWLWRPVPENIALVRNDRFGPLFETLGLEFARCYLEAATADEEAGALGPRIAKRTAASAPKTVQSLCPQVTPVAAKFS